MLCKVVDAKLRCANFNWPIWNFVCLFKRSQEKRKRLSAGEWGFSWFAIIKFHKLGCLETDSFLIIPKAEKWKIRILAFGVWWALSSDSCVLTWRIETRELRGVYFYKSTNPNHRGSTLMTQSPPKAPPPNNIPLGIRFQHMNWSVCVWGGGG